MKTIGIDLGTSHSSLATAGAVGEVSLLQIPQLEGSAEVFEHPLLPSVLFREPALQNQAWMQGQDIVGRWARQLAAENPERAIVSAKSWLCYKRDVRLPPNASWEGLTALEASTKILNHLLEAWERKSGLNRSELETVVLTVPASFDPISRELTERAAAAAGLSTITLLEEPLSAFYAWLAQHEKTWQQQLKVGDLVLVCDVGGGTCDLSLIAVLDNAGDLELERVAVGRHLLLGGDNMDLALAHSLLAEAPQLDRWQLQSLQMQARLAKENLLGPDAADSYPIAVASRGSNLFAQTQRFDLTKSRVQDLIVDGFFPLCERDAVPERPRALQQLGLPYEADPAITKHLAAFLRQAEKTLAAHDKHKILLADGRISPSHILFNGGVFQAQVLQDRVAACIRHWVGKAVQILPSTHPEYAVSLGAAHYASWIQHGHHLRVRAAAARSYYIGLESNELAVPGLPRRLKGLCVLPQGTEEGSRLQLSEQAFGLWPGESVHFRLFASQERADDKLGDLIPDADRDLEAVADLSCPIDGSDEEAIPVFLTSAFDETGTLRVGMQESEGGRSWQLNFQLRDGHG